MDRGAWRARVHAVTESDMTSGLNNDKGKINKKQGRTMCCWAWVGGRQFFKYIFIFIPFCAYVTYVNIKKLAPAISEK